MYKLTFNNLLFTKQENDLRTREESPWKRSSVYFAASHVRQLIQQMNLVIIRMPLGDLQFHTFLAKHIEIYSYLFPCTD